ncbi:MAG TPA: hemolysin family protein [Acidimicrobiia bacterium]|nr:hemolysin family protein [Acidimicrobiia bacterium]
MESVWPQLLLVSVLVVLNGVLSGSEMALISLREAQVSRLGQSGRSGRVVARLARDPNRFLATIQIGITLAGFLASAAAAVTLATPLISYLGWFGGAADTVAIILVTMVLSFFTLVFGELAPKRLALQRSERWALLAARPLDWMATATRPIVWLLSASTDLVVRLFGGEPGATREEVDMRELRDMVIANRSMSEAHQEVVVGAFEVADRTLREVLIPRPDVFVLDEGVPAEESLHALVAAKHSRAPVAPDAVLDEAVSIVTLRDLIQAESGVTIDAVASPALSFPDSLTVLGALRQMQEQRQQMALVVDEFGGVDGIVTIEDLVEELVGEIYDETDPQVRAVIRRDDGTIVVSGRYPIHDLVDIGIDLPAGEYTTVAGLVLDALGEVPTGPGASVVIGDWELRVAAVRGRAIEQVDFRRRPAGQ